MAQGLRHKQCASVLAPVRKWIAAGLTEGLNQPPYVLSSLMHRMDHALQSLTVILVPFCRNPLRTAPNINDVRLLGPGESRLNGFPSGDSPVYTVASVYTTQRLIGKCPLPGVQTVSVIDEAHLVISRPAFSGEDCLASIGVGQPLIDHQDLCKATGHHDLVHKALRQVVEYFHGLICRVTRVTRSKLQSAAARNLGASQLDAQLWRVLDQPVAYFYGCNLWHGQAKPQAQLSRKHFIGQNSWRLWVIQKFGHKVRAVGGSQKMGLRSAAHSANVLDCVKRNTHIDFGIW